MNREQCLKKKIIQTGRDLYSLRLVVAKGGNLSCRLKDKRILITATGTCLGHLKQKDIFAVDANNPQVSLLRKVTCEFPLHSLIYKQLDPQCVIHCHSPLTNAYFAAYSSLSYVTFENKVYLGKVPVVYMASPTITEPQLVVKALKENPIAVIRKHGVVSIGKDFKEAFFLVEELEEACKMAGFVRLLKERSPDEFKLALLGKAGYRQAV